MFILKKILQHLTTYIFKIINQYLLYFYLVNFDIQIYQTLTTNNIKSNEITNIFTSNNFLALPKYS